MLVYLAELSPSFGSIACLSVSVRFVQFVISVVFSRCRSSIHSLLLILEIVNFIVMKANKRSN